MDLFMALKELGYGDAGVAWEVLQGMATIGPVPHSGEHEEKLREATLGKEDLFATARWAQST